ncbi:MAG: type I-C CRISPR-associated protein Cas8c/Csd1 [Cloacibacillus sp.]
MSWMQRLEETYENAYKRRENFNSLPVPPAHVEQQAHIEVVLDGEGNFLTASVVNKEATLIPATEASAGRTSGGEPHPLCDKIQYTAGDYKAHGGISNAYFDDFKSGNETKAGYLSLLSAWNDFYDHPMLKAIYKYVTKRCLIADLVASKVLFLDEKGNLLTEWNGKETPSIFKILTKKKDKSGESVYDQGGALVRWCVQIPGRLEDKVWECAELAESWIRFNGSRQSESSLCYISGEEKPYAVNHPARLRYSGDKAKLISANDLNGYTFRGRFVSPEEACTVGYDVTQKAHSALRWLIEQQGFKNDSQVIVAWAVSNAKIPPLCESSDDLFLDSLDESEETENLSGNNIEDIGASYAKRLNKKLAGYKKELKDRDDIVVMALDSATPGRMAITYYQEIKGSDFLARVEDYHKKYAWRQHFGKDKEFIGAPSIYDIAQLAFAGKTAPLLLKATVSRLLPVISEGRAFPLDLLLAVCRRTAQPQSMERWEFEKILGVACGLYSGCHPERRYKMALEEDRTTRDYLYGRLLAVADKLEGRALHIAGESRDTSAMKLMARFAEKPSETWRQIEINLLPYCSRLQAKAEKELPAFNIQMDKIYSAFRPGEFEDNSPLSSEFLLGFHCQRYELWNNQKSNETPNVASETKKD